MPPTMAAARLVVAGAPALAYAEMMSTAPDCGGNERAGDTAARPGRDQAEDTGAEPKHHDVSDRTERRLVERSAWDGQAIAELVDDAIGDAQQRAETEAGQAAVTIVRQ